MFISVMSRVGNKPISIPGGVNCSLLGNVFTVKGPKGTLSQLLVDDVNVLVTGSTIEVSPVRSIPSVRALQGTIRSLLFNMVQGVVQPYFKDLEISGVGFRAAVSNSLLTLNLGYAEPRRYPIPAGISIDVTDGVKLKVSGIDKQLVGEVAARIRSYYPVEPYKGKGVRIVGQFVVRKEGKKTS